MDFPVPRIEEVYTTIERGGKLYHIIQLCITKDMVREESEKEKRKTSSILIHGLDEFFQGRSNFSKGSYFDILPGNVKYRYLVCVKLFLAVN